MTSQNTIHPTAIVSKKTQIGKNVAIGPFTVVYDNVVIGDNTVIDGFCEIGYPTKLADEETLVIGKNSLIRSHSIFYQGSVFGEELVTGHHVTIREKTIAGKNLHIGSLCDFQGNITIGDYARTHSKVHIGEHSTIGNFVWIFPYVVLTNDPCPPSNQLFGVTVEDYAVIAAKSVILPGVNIGTHSLVAAQSMVRRDVLPYQVVAGCPARRICDTSAIKLKDGSGGDAYPWPRHFHRGYPPHIVDQWNKTYQ
jgi:acyl-[acyl carrier protein]--UDP-N-acetylglucosamine O-acyltransferase